ncbi:hypothetical protein IAR50_006243 [Cryptococcus sp. DSM 104548]
MTPSRMSKMPNRQGITRAVVDRARGCVDNPNLPSATTPSAPRQQLPPQNQGPYQKSKSDEMEGLEDNCSEDESDDDDLMGPRELDERTEREQEETEAAIKELMEKQNTQYVLMSPDLLPIAGYVWGSECWRRLVKYLRTYKDGAPEVEVCDDTWRKYHRLDTTAEPSAFTWSEVPSEPDCGIAAEDLMDKDTELPNKPSLANRILQRLDDIDTTIYRIQPEPITLLSDLLGYMAEGHITMSDRGRLSDSVVRDSKAAGKEVQEKLDRVLAALLSLSCDGIDHGSSIGTLVANIESLVRILVDNGLTSGGSTRAAPAARHRPASPDYHSAFSQLDNNSSSSPSRNRPRSKTSLLTEEAISAAVTQGITTYLAGTQRFHAFQATVSRSLSILEHIPETKGINQTLKMAKEELEEASRLQRFQERGRLLLGSVSDRLSVALMFLRQFEEDGWKVGILESVIDDLKTTAEMA